MTDQDKDTYAAVLSISEMYGEDERSSAADDYVRARWEGDSDTLADMITALREAVTAQRMFDLCTEQIVEPDFLPPNSGFTFNAERGVKLSLKQRDSAIQHFLAAAESVRFRHP